MLIVRPVPVRMVMRVVLSVFICALKSERLCLGLWEDSGQSTPRPFGPTDSGIPAGLSKLTSSKAARCLHPSYL